MEGKPVWQWLKPLLLILPVLAVTLLALWELVDQNATHHGATTLNQLVLIDEQDQSELAPGQSGNLLAPKEERIDQLKGLLSNSQNRIASWEELVTLISRTAPSVADFGNSFGSTVHVQIPDSTINEPVKSTDDNNQPASAPTPESGNGTTATTGNNSGSGNSSSGDGDGDGDDDCDSSGPGNYCDDDCDSSGPGNYCDEDD